MLWVAFLYDDSQGGLISPSVYNANVRRPHDTTPLATSPASIGGTTYCNMSPPGSLPSTSRRSSPVMPQTSLPSGMKTYSTMGKEGRNPDSDKRLLALGYKPEFRREMSLFGVLGISFCAIGILTGMSSAFQTGLFSGGPLGEDFAILDSLRT